MYVYLYMQHAVYDTYIYIHKHIHVKVHEYMRESKLRQKYMKTDLSDAVQRIAV